MSVVGECQRVMLQAVQELYETEPVGVWPEDTPRSCRLVLIGRGLFSILCSHGHQPSLVLTL